MNRRPSPSAEAALEKALVKNAADPEQVAAAGEVEQDRREQRDIDLATVLSSAEGRRFYWALLADCGINASVIGADAYATYYNAGRQDVGHRLLARVIETDVTLYGLMQREAHEEIKKQ